MLPFTFWTDLRYKEPPSVIFTEGGVFTENNYSINWNLYVYLKITKIKNTVTMLELVCAVYFAKCIVNSIDYSDGNIDFVMRRTYFLYVKLSDFINRIHKFNRIRRWVECIKASAIYQISRIQVSTLFLIKATMSGRVSGSIKHLKPSIA